MVMRNKEIISELGNLDLSTYPYDDVLRLVSQFQIKTIRLTIRKGATIERIRPDVNVYERKDVSYKPADENDKTQRATLPHQTAFYGTMCHEDDPLYNNRYVALMESSKLLKQGICAEGTEQYTLSRWITNSPLMLAVFAHDSIYPNVQNNRLLSMAKEAFLKYRTLVDEPMQFDIFEKFATELFAKPVEAPKNYEYIISATIAKILMYASRCDGVMYPSVPSLGQYGMNVALRPDVADEKLILTEVNELEYVQKDGEGRFSFLRRAVPTDMDERGYKKWKYAPCFH